MSGGIDNTKWVRAKDKKKHGNCTAVCPTILGLLLFSIPSRRDASLWERLFAEPRIGQGMPKRKMRMEEHVSLFTFTFGLKLNGKVMKKNEMKGFWNKKSAKRYKFCFVEDKEVVFLCCNMECAGRLMSVPNESRSHPEGN